MEKSIPTMAGRPRMASSSHGSTHASKYSMGSAACRSATNVARYCV